MAQSGGSPEGGMEVFGDDSDLSLSEYGDWVCGQLLWGWRREFNGKLHSSVDCHLSAPQFWRMYIHVAEFNHCSLGQSFLGPVRMLTGAVCVVCVVCMCVCACTRV